MKRRKIILMALISVVILGGAVKMLSNEHTDPVSEAVDELYMNEKGLIHAYPYQEQSQYLSESIGLYMEYLLQTKNKEGFQEQYAYLVDHFLVQIDEAYYLKWELGDSVKTNALIDDVRIIYSLQEAESLFHVPGYRRLGDKLLKTLKSTQKVNVIYVDHYDWSLGEMGSKLTLSYLTPEMFDLSSEFANMKSYLRNIDTSEVFFPEYYDVAKNKYVSFEKVNMIDQILIALNYEEVGGDAEAFEEWITKEWKTGSVKGRYERGSLQPIVSYESLSVYYYLFKYFNAIGKSDLANEVKLYATELFQDTEESELHFFDYIQYQMMHIEAERSE